MTDTTHSGSTRADDGTTDRREGQEATRDPGQDPRQHPGQDPLDPATPVQRLDPNGPGDRAAGQPVNDQTLSTSDLVDRGNQSRAGDDPTGAAGPDDKPTPLISDGDAYLDRWQTVQAGFVDDPRTAVQRADALVAEVIQRIAESFAGERDQLEKQWSGGENVGTEELRVQLQRYRSFFTRLLQT